MVAAIENNNITVTAPGDTDGTAITVNSASGSETSPNISNNKIIVNATGGDGVAIGIVLQDNTFTERINVSQNNITVSGDQPENTGLRVEGTGGLYQLENNNINSSGNFSYALDLQNLAAPNGFTMINSLSNLFRATGEDSPSGLNAFGGSNGFLVSSQSDTFRSIGSDAIGIYIEQIQRLEFFDTIVDVQGFDNYGISVFDASQFNFTRSLVNTSANFVDVQTPSPPTSLFTNLTMQAPLGNVTFTDTIFFDSDVVTNSTVSFSNQTITVNVSEVSALNTTANINIFNGSVAVPALFVDFNDDGTFVPCPGTVCSAVSLAAGIASFTVQHFTSFQVQDASMAAVPELSTMALMAALVVILGGFVVMRRRE